MPRVPTVTPRGPVIQDLRMRNGLSRKELGDKANCGQEMIRLVEVREHFRAGRLLVCRIAKALQVDVDELIVPDAEDVAA